ncbi:MAG: division/cell wall cluster transcriptional repressor MraZ [Clostridium sp.]|nr:division/cell wall cluster transcriptional repressor MraZ [Clostridium sp.]MBQ5421701.1 division/cell wall cluster transcriptional repressor MraZ [Clostridium sp.]HAE80432.1 division/cell wall cluster transcriptional repressor MraZ [Lachnoclostridium sp.]
MLGQYDHTIDAKGRIIIPAKFREQMGDDFIITKGLDHQLFVYAPDEWNLFEAKLRALPISNPQARKLSRFFLVGASDVTVDKQGRITLPMQLREFAGITRDVLLAGVGNHLEIWNPDRYNELNTYEDMDEVAMSLEGFNI